MRNKALIIFLILLFAVTAFSQSPQKPVEEQPIRISTELVQLDVVVTDKNGRVVRGLSKNDFELYEKGKKQLISFFEFVDAAKAKANVPGQQPSPQGATEGDIRRIFAFVVDDLTIRYEDLVYVRQMLTNFVDTQMQPSDLVAIVRTVGGKGLLQQFTTDKELLRRTIASLTPSTHPFSAFNNPELSRIGERPGALSDGGGPVAGGTETLTEEVDIISPSEDANKTLRALMSLGTASFVVDSMKQLPGRKSLVLISGGLPIFSSQPGVIFSNVSMFLNQLSDKATRAGVAIHTLDIRGLGAQSAVASFADTPARSGLASSGAQMGGRSSNRSAGDIVSGGGSTTEGGTEGFGRVADQRQFGFNNPFDVTSAHMGLRTLSSVTGGIAVLNRNDFNAGLQKIVDANEGYYLVAYTPSDNKFKGDFREVKIKVKGDDFRVYNRKGYLAREDRPAAAPTTREEQLLAAIKSPLARRDVELDAMLLYKATSAPATAGESGKPEARSSQSSWGAIDINLIVDSKKLRFEQTDGKQQTSYDVAGFVFDELGKLRGGFSETVNAALTPEEYKLVSKTGLSYPAKTTLPPGTYQIRLAVRDNKSGSIGTLSRLVEVPDLSKGRLTASSLLLGAVAPNETTATTPTPITGNRQISRKQDVRYAAIIYNAKLENGKPQIKTQLMISQNGKVIFKEPEETLETSLKNSSQLIKVGQLGLSGVGPGRYTMTLVITDALADKKAQTVTRNMDFIVVN